MSGYAVDTQTQQGLSWRFCGVNPTDVYFFNAYYCVAGSPVACAAANLQYKATRKISRALAALHAILLVALREVYSNPSDLELWILLRRCVQISGADNGGLHRPAVGYRALLRLRETLFVLR